MTQLRQYYFALILLSLGVSTHTRQFLPIFREERSLRDTFPFSLQEDPVHQLDVDNNVADVRDSLLRDAKQGEASGVGSIPFTDVASSYAQGKRCIDKVFMEEITEYDTEVTCQHSYNRRCAKSLITVYNSAQEEECEENYVKNCFIEYSKTAVNVTAKVCRTPLVKDCDIEGDEICRTEYESECVTQQEVHDVEDDVVECRTEVEEKCEDETSGYTTNTKCSKWPKEVCSVTKKAVKKYTPQTRCEKIPVELCGPAGCGFVPGAEQCQDRTQTVVGDNPEETCSLDPQTTCKHVTKLVPSLKEVERCFDVPKEVCVRSENNPRKVKVPVVKKWCYVVACPDECVEAAKEGQCPASCKEHEGNSRCCAPCSLECQAAARNDQCLDACRQYEGNPTCCGGCSQKCRDAARNKQTAPECRQYRGNPDCYYEETDPCPATCRRDPEQPSCSRYSNIPGCYIQPVVACGDLPQCEDAAKRGVCLNECWREFGESAGCCPTCPEICKQFAKEEKTFTNSTIDLDCADFSDPECYFECPSRCRQAFNNGETRDDCKKYSYLPQCYKEPPCPQTCLDAAAKEQCPSQCEQFKGTKECCFECPTKCKEAYDDGESDESCKKYNYLPECYRECPTKCENSFKNQVVDRECERYASVPGCYYTPCSQTCMTEAAADKCPRQCERFEGNRACCGGCPRECKNAFNQKRTLEKCRKYNMEFDNCFYEECPSKCMTAAAKGECPSECEQYAGNPKCCIRSDCPLDCQEKSLWGECPKKCKEFAGNPDCCAATCPAKCTNRRRKECSAGGVNECDGIAGCCPEHFDIVFGAGVYLESDNQ